MLLYFFSRMRIDVVLTYKLYQAKSLSLKGLRALFYNDKKTENAISSSIINIPLAGREKTNDQVVESVSGHQ